jgi:hypothetical protein
MWSICTVEHYLAIKRSGALRHATTWKNLENLPHKKLVTTGHMAYNSVYMNCPE